MLGRGKTSLSSSGDLSKKEIEGGRGSYVQRKHGPLGLVKDVAGLQPQT